MTWESRNKRKGKNVAISGTQGEQSNLAEDKTNVSNRWERKFEGWMGMRSLQELKCQSNDFLLQWEAVGGFSFCLLSARKNKSQNITEAVWA